MLAGLVARLRRTLAGAKRAAAEEAIDRLNQLRESMLDEADLLAQDRAELEQRIRRNAARGRQALGGERPA